VPVGVVGGPTLDLAGIFGVPLEELRAAHETTVPALFD
jgi:hypothetical protein